MAHEETIKERINRKFDRLQRAIESCTSLDIVDSVFYLGEDSKVFSDEQFDKLESLYRQFHEECDCNKRQQNIDPNVEIIHLKSPPHK